MHFLERFSKVASIGMNQFLGGTQGKGDVADTVVTQLKWESSSDAIPENFGYNEDKPETKTQPLRRVLKLLKKVKRS